MLTVLVDGKFVQPASLTFSATDPGGFEACSFTLENAPSARPGADIKILDGLTTAWHGRIEDPGRQIQRGKTTDQINGVGYGAELKENPFSMVYIDRDQSRWTEISNTRKNNLISSTFGVQGIETNFEPNGRPAVSTVITGAWTVGQQPVSEAWYDAGSGNLISTLYSDWTRGPDVNAADANWTWQVFLAETDVVSGGFTSTGTLRAAGPGSVSLTYPAGLRYAALQFFYANIAAGSANARFNIDWSNLIVVGNHGVAQSSSTNSTRGLLLSELIDDVVSRGGGRFDRLIEPNDFSVTQFAFYTPTDSATMLEQLRTLSGWHYGVWEPSSVTSSNPTFMFLRPPANATATVALRDCDEVDVTESYSSMHDEISGTYTDAQGKQSFATAFIPHPRLLQNDHHSLLVDLGTSNAAAASAIAQYLLVLDQSSSRVSGSAILPSRLKDGRAAHLLRPGRDKLRIRDLSTSGSLLASPPARIDTFRVSRTSTELNQTGQPVTTVEFDNGADLIEVLQARLAQSNSLAGF